MLSRTRCSRDSRRNGDETQLFFVSVTTWALVHMHVPHNLHWVYLYTLACFPLVSTSTSDSGSQYPKARPAGCSSFAPPQLSTRLTQGAGAAWARRARPALRSANLSEDRRRGMSEHGETTPFRFDRSQGSSPTPTDEHLRRGVDPDRKWPWVMLGVFMGVMLIVLQSGDASTCSPHLAVMMGFMPGTLAGIAATKFWIGGNANAILLSAGKLRQQVVSAVMQTPVSRGGAPHAEA